MKHEIITGKADSLDYDCIVVGVFSKGKMPANTQRLDKAGQGSIQKLLKSGDHSGDVGEAVMLYAIPDISARRIMVVGLGAQKDLNDKHYSKAVTKATKALRKSGCKSAAIMLADIDYPDSTAGARVRLAAQTVGVAMYRYHKTKSSNFDQN